MARPDHVVSELVVRAVLNADLPEALFDTVVGVSLNGTGKVVVGASGQSGIIGVLVPTKWLSKAGAQVDIHRVGDIVDIEGLAAGTRYWVAADGTLTTAETAGLVYAGATVEADRLVLSGFGIGEGGASVTQTTAPAAAPVPFADLTAAATKFNELRTALIASGVFTS